MSKALVLLIFSIVMLFVFALLRPHKRIMFWCFLTTTYWYCALASKFTQLTTAHVVMFIGGYMSFLVFCHVLLWQIGGAHLFFPNTLVGAPLNVLILEVLPCYLLVHMHLLRFFIGDYSFAVSTFSRIGGILFVVGIFLLCFPLAAFILWRWYRTGMLKWLICLTLKIVIGIVCLSSLAATKDITLHLHHYFLGLVGYLMARGQSWIAAIARGLCLGMFINGLVFWGDRYNLAIWGVGSAWLPPIGSLSTEAWGTVPVQWTSASALPGGGGVLLSWALQSDIESNCSGQLESVNDDELFVVEMNHVEMYRGKERSRSFRFPLGPTVFYFRVGLVRRAEHYFDIGTSSWSESAESLASWQELRTTAASVVIAVRDMHPPVKLYYNDTSNLCERTTILQSQPSTTLSHYA